MFASSASESIAAEGTGVYPRKASQPVEKDLASGKLVKGREGQKQLADGAFST